MTEIVWKRLEDVTPQYVTEGISVCLLWQGKSNSQAMVVEIAPGAKWNGIDSHDDNSEEIFVISGIFNDGLRDYPAGTFIHHPIGSSHIPQSMTGCKLFIFYPAKLSK
ncbi:anti-ECFsigma factor, ChrR [[Leptolyngbya] sp. PCC 7376]|uniref:cupin domain-containing protein n=1 Tax=[Leptolyngbya] sp. PCC 7376 TaxID=111781 RepID=UPI00029F2E90|nr:cupin domain-containing protein [[Leptolyngbya] sp. PCC 7376]AFY40383.1 anti-ECFsigma factor, ChrR [[Leptolyngbya] sp. PCC 7376]